MKYDKMTLGLDGSDFRVSASLPGAVTTLVAPTKGFVSASLIFYGTQVDYLPLRFGLMIA